MTTPAAPTLSLATDKPSYSVGDQIQVTATYSDQSGGGTVTLTISGTATDAAGNTVDASAQVEVITPSSSQPMDVTVSDDFGDQYQQVSNDGTGTAVFTSVIGTPPAQA